MLINCFLKQKLSYNQIEYYSNTVFLLISSYILFTNHYNIHYDFSIHIMKYYICLDLLFIPYSKFDMILHHIFTVIAINYIESNDIDLSTNYFALSQLYNLETTNIFLGLMVYLKPYNNVLFINQLCFLFSFLKIRIYDFHHNVIFNNQFYESLGTTTSQLNYQYVTVGVIYALNIYWAMILIKMAVKPYFKYIKKVDAEYLLQFTYILNTLTTIISYGLILNENDKIIYGEYTLLDVSSNCLLTYSSYLFHNFWYEQLIQNEDYDHFNHTYFQYLIFDIISIHIRIITQIYCNLHMNNKYNDFPIHYFIGCSCTSIYTLYYIFYDSIKNNLSNISNTNNKKYYTILQLLYGIPPAIGIMFSTIPVINTYQSGYTLWLIFLIISLMKIEPFYNYTQISIHVLMCVVNYFLVLNNTYTITTNT